MNAQNGPSLITMEEFAPQSGNWSIVGEVFMERTIDIHKKDLETTNTNKKRKRKRKPTEPKTRNAVTFSDGTGILLNNPNDTNKDNLLTNWKHGDIKIELEVMLPKGSNSGIYLQGRYEVQLFDSWGVKNPKFSDIGGIYRNWEEDPEKMFLGVAPATNAAKAPGLWQTLSIDFEAPKFDENGNKIANAKFVSVSLNGIVIHQNVEIPRPTGGPISNEEVAMGPLMIQGDHGPVAFRNIKIKQLAPSKIEVYDLTAQIYQGPVELEKGLDTTQLSKPQKVSEIDVTKFGLNDNYWVVFEGKLKVPKTDRYDFLLGLTGGVSLSIDGKVVDQIYSKDSWGAMETSTEISSGEHSIRIENMKAAPWHGPRLGLTISSPNTKPKTFNAYDSYPPIGNLVSQIYVTVENEPELLRGFVFFKGNDEKLSHTIGVGTPHGVHYIYDLESGNMVGAWRGNFINATPMWHNRGNGSFRPDGVTIWTFLNQPLAELTSMDLPFPDNDKTEGYKPKGYSIDPANKMPVFNYEYKGTKVSQTITTDQDESSLISEIQFSNQSLVNHYYKLAEGDLEILPDGSYRVNDAYYLNMVTNQNVIVRTNNGKQELLAPIDGTPLKFKTIW
ncbi:family 16 glycoside hydrolase [Croceivirga thetidis]|uniref:family 16 glycoside hydrolase n=1 Tax=Croceivirga thetidis TaxID=2721623 RepID=UPI001B2FFC49|nr:family 16 glycoside hydrolase [Croceivirga thetidis]